jgi:1-aminocyclopropane-1-carboxylate deaminase/D-cysteine desulfhydrase-like pyridoxal-dependent ACC family enzyme
LGGYYSNHLIATAYTANQATLKSKGVIRGERPKILSPTLQDCLNLGMELTFLKRSEFDQFNPIVYLENHPKHLFIPQGGFGPIGKKGAASMMELPGIEDYEIILAASGTGTMAAGLISQLLPHQHLEIISVLKGNLSLEQDICSLLSDEEKAGKQFSVYHQFHEGGYARHTPDLLHSMNKFYNETGIATDFVYTGKLIHAFFTALENNNNWHKKKVLLIHSGGLQGNRSLNKNDLVF